MSTRGRSWTRTGNRIGVWMYRVLDGRSFGGGKDAGVLMITVPGRRTGVARSTCVRFLETPEGLVVWGTGSGSRHDPDWFQNLRTAAVAQVQVRDRHLQVRPRELVGPERDAMWDDIIVRKIPAVARYARRARRTIPVAVLEPQRQ